MMANNFSDEIMQLQKYFIELGKSTMAQINQATSAFIDHDKVRAQQLIEAQTFNGHDEWLEASALKLMVLQQPVAADFRNVVSILKASSDFERISDHAVSIAKETVRVKGNARIPQIETGIADMTSVVQEMMADILAAYLEQDSEKARKVAELDDTIDAAYKNLRDAIIDSVDRDDDTIIASFSYFMVIRLLERIGDHIVNIAKWVIYNESGEMNAVE
jgi:phosphate transport system protein